MPHPLRRLRRHRRNHGMTMIEILVVVVIIFILVGILYPALAGAKRKARTAVCATQQKQIMVGIQTYISDCDGYLPLPGRGMPNEYSLGAPGPDLYQVLGGRVVNQELYWCPAVQEGDTWMDGTVYRVQTYYYNAWALTGDPAVLGCRPRGRRANEVTDPSIAVVLWDSPWWGKNVHAPIPGVQHNGGLNATYLDGHVKWHRVADDRDFRSTHERAGWRP